MSCRLSDFARASGRARIRTAILAIVQCITLGACSSLPNDARRSYPTLGTTADHGCNRKDSVELYELKDETGKNQRKALPLKVPPGTYSIGSSCAWVYSQELNRCIDVRSNPAAFSPAYPLVLKANVDYNFTCAQLKLDESGKHEVTMIVGKKQIPIDATYDLRLKESKRNQAGK